MLWQANPDEETTDWRAVCGRTARTVRREGKARAFLYPYQSANPTGLLLASPSGYFTTWVAACAGTTNLPLGRHHQSGIRLDPRLLYHPGPYINFILQELPQFVGCIYYWIGALRGQLFHY